MYDLICVKLLTAKSFAIDTVKKFVKGKEEGAALVEYGLLVGLIAVGCIVAITTLGGTIAGYFGSINAAL